MAMNVTLCWWS